MKQETRTVFNKDTLSENLKRNSLRCIKAWGLNQNDYLCNRNVSFDYFEIRQ